MYAITTENGWWFFSEHDIKEQTAIYYQKLYTPRILPPYNHLWTNFIEKHNNILREQALWEGILQQRNHQTRSLKNYTNPKK